MTTITLEEIADGLRSQLKMACQAARQEAAVADKALRDLAAAQEALSAKDAELASVRAHAEASGDEVVRELQRVVLPSLRDYGQGYSAAVAERAASHIIALRAELASVSGHAEAMAVTLDSWARLDGGCKCAALDAYRAAYPKDAP